MSDEPSESPRPEGSASRPPVDAKGTAMPPPPPPGYVSAAHHSPPPPPPPRRPSRLAGVVVAVLGCLIAAVLILSIVLNIYSFGVIASTFSGGIVQTTYQAGDSSQRIVILPIEGLINQDTARFVHAAVHKLRKNPPKALVLRVESGGGYVASADQIWNDLNRLTASTHIPMIASFGGIAASGGYYIAAGADAIVAEPTTVTGSIGVIAPAFTVQDLLHKIGVTPEVVTSTHSTKKNELYPFHQWTPEARAEVRSMLDSMYDRFVQVVYQGRSKVVKITPEQVRHLATGEAYTEKEAKTLKLIDQEGYLDDAIRLAQSKAGIPSNIQPQVSRLEPRRSLGIWSLLGLGLEPGKSAQMMKRIDGQTLRDGLMEMSAPRLLYYADLR